MQIKKFLATGLSAVMAGATLAGGALAATPLSDYPDFLGSNGQIDAFVVVGADAQPADIVGAGDVVAGLASLSYTMVSSGTGAPSVAGAQTEDMDLGSDLSSNTIFTTTLDDADLEGLFDGEVTMSVGGTSETYDAHEEIRLTAAKVSVETALSADSPDEDFGSDIFLQVLSGGVGYYYVFDEALKDTPNITDATNDDPIRLNFMGRELYITNADTDSITVDVGERFVLNAGESATTSDGKTVTLVKSLTGAKAQVSVNGATDIVDEDSVRSLGGTEIKVTDVADDDGIEFDSATIIVGTAATFGEASDTFDDGEEYIIPCGTLWKSDGCDEDDPDWVWDLASLQTANPTLGVVFGDNRISTPDDNAPTVGSENNVLDLPGGFAWIKLDKVTTESYQDYEITEKVVTLRNSAGDELSADQKVIELSGEGNDDAFSLTLAAGAGGGSKETDKLYIYVNGSTTPDSVNVFWEDSDDGNKIKNTGINLTSNSTSTSAAFAALNFESASVNLDLNASINSGIAGDVTTFYLNITGGSVAEELQFYFEESADGEVTYTGDSDSDTSTANDVKYGGRDISGWEEDVRTPAGLVLYNPDSNAASDKIRFSVPSEYGSNDFQVFVTIGASGASTSISSSGDVKQLVPITGSITKLDTEVGAAEKAKNLVLVGGPAVNRLTAEAMGLTYPTYGAASGIAENTAWIKVVDDAFTTGKAAVIVAGYEADNTRLGTSVLQQAATKLAGISASEVTVTGASVASAVITPV
jgi:hypothetical protein